MAEGSIFARAPSQILQEKKEIELVEYKKQGSEKTYKRLLLQNEEGKVFDYQLVLIKLKNRGIDPAKVDWKRELEKESNWMEKEGPRGWKSSFGRGFEFSFGSSGTENKEIAIQKGVVISKIEQKKNDVEAEVPFVISQNKSSGIDRMELFLDGVNNAPIHRNVVGFLEKEKYLKTLLGRLKKYVAYAEKFAIQYGLDPLLVLAVICTESEGKPKAESKNLGDVGSSKGLMQISDGTWPELRGDLGLGEDPFGAKDNIHAGAYYLHFLLHEKCGNSVPKALLAYNRGFRGADDFLKLEKKVDEKTLAEIVDYPAKVLSFYQLLEHLGGLNMLKVKDGIKDALIGFDSKAYIEEHSIKS